MKIIKISKEMFECLSLNARLNKNFGYLVKGEKGEVVAVKNERASYLTKSFTSVSDKEAIQWLTDGKDCQLVCFPYHKLGSLDCTAPQQIYLNINPEGDRDDRSGDFKDLAEVTWCEDSLGGQEVGYIRADLVLELLNGK